MTSLLVFEWYLYTNRVSVPVVVVVVTTCYCIPIVSGEDVFTGAATHSGVTFPGTYLLTRLVVGTGIMVTEVVIGVDRVIVHMHVYSDVLVVNTTVYSILMVVNLSM